MALQLSRSRLDGLIEICRNYDVFPIELPHYFYPQGGWHPVTRFLAPLVGGVEADIDRMDFGELRTLVSSLPDVLQMSIRLDGESQGGLSRSQSIALAWLCNEMTGSYFSLREVVHPGAKESIVFARFPELRESVDKDGLLQIGPRMTLKGSGIFYRDSVLHYHQLLRRGFSARPNGDFLGPLARFASSAGCACSLRVAIDDRRLMPAEFYEEVIELDTWYGPRFGQTSLDDPNDVSSTILTRSRPSPFDSRGTIDRTEIHRSVSGDIKTFEIEEVSSPSHKFGEFILNRYVHAERDMPRGAFRHFDGAVKVYTEVGYRARYDVRKPDKNSLKKIKLFRVDGEVDADSWILLTSQFFKGNELVVEHFDENVYKEKLQPIIDRYQAAVRARTLDSA